MTSLIDRFRGEHGQRVLRDALSRQGLLLGLDGVIDELTRAAILQEYTAGAGIIQQGAVDNDIAFIVSGRVAIVINARLINTRRAGQHIGEMALIDASAKRSASVIASEETILARVDEHIFSDVADRNPQLWRRLAIEIADRLRQRTKGIRPPNELPHVFIGSSSEALPVAQALKTGLSDDKIIVGVWNVGVFQASDTVIESLETEIMQSDFAVLVLAPDDHVESRDLRQSAPRDNVIFELGLFMGALGRSRTYIASLRGGAVKQPSDLLGINVVSYLPPSNAGFKESVAVACAEIRGRVSLLGPK